MDATTQAALRQLDTSALIDFLVALVRTPSVYLPSIAGANEEAAARLIYRQLAEWGWQPLWEEAAPGRPNLVAELSGAQGAQGPLLLFEGHTDVVTPGDPAAWQHAPFGGEIVGRRLYGRGAADMKGGVAALLFAARAIQQSGASFAGRIRLLIPVDEEGLMLGIKALVAAGHADGAAGAIICEPEQREVCVAQKGALRLRLISHGRIAHGAMPTEGVNALAGLVRALNRLLDLERELQAAHGAHALLGDFYMSPTVARAPLSGDISQINCLPDLCDAFLDIRTIPSLDHAGLLERIRHLLDELSTPQSDYRFELEVIDDRPATATPIEHPLVQALVAAHRQVYGATPEYGGVPGSTDGTILARERGIPVVVYGPGDKRIPHQPDEFVDLDEVVRAAQVYIIAALDFLRRAP